MKLIFIGADHEVTGSCHYLQVGEKHILVDYGMQQGIDAFENAELPGCEAKMDYVLLTHAHVDHSGMLPQLAARGFRGQILTRQRQTFAALCFVTVHISRCRMRSGRTARRSEVQTMHS